MSIDLFVVSMEPKKVRQIKAGENIVTSPDGEQALAIKLEELFTTVTKTVSESLEVESQLIVEVSGSLGIQAEAGAKYLFFNVGGKTEAVGSMKVTLSTTLKPKSK